MDCDAQDIYQWLHDVTSAASAMPEVALLSGERMALSGHLFQEAEPFVRHVAAALRERPELYGDIPVDPACLLRRQDRAQALRKLHAALQLYAQRAADWCLIEQSAAVRDALSVVQQVRADGAGPYPRPDQGRREDELALAERVLRRRRERRRAPRAEDEGGPRTPPGEAQRRAAAEYARALRAREADRLAARVAPAPAAEPAPSPVDTRPASAAPAEAAPPEDAPPSTTAVAARTHAVSELHAARGEPQAPIVSGPPGWTSGVAQTILQPLRSPIGRRLQKANRRRSK